MNSMINPPSIQPNVMTGFERSHTSHARKQVARVRNYVDKQTESLHFRLALAQAVIRFIPYGAFGNMRSLIYRRCGFGINSKVYIAGTLELRGDGDIYSRLQIEEHTFINTPCFIELNAPIHIGRHVGIGHHTAFITSNHEIGPPDARMGKVKPAPVTIGDGAWIGAGAMILPGVTIGAGAFVTAGAVVTRDVPANAKVAGVHAKITGWLDGSEVSSKS
jgi:maltose O-acetyltransferase